MIVSRVEREPVGVVPSEETVDLSRIFGSPDEVISLLGSVVAENRRPDIQRKIQIELRSVGETLGSDQLEQLFVHLRQTQEFAPARIRKLEATLPPGTFSLVRWLGGRLGKLQTGSGEPLFRKSELYPAAWEILVMLSEGLATTPAEYVPEPTPQGKILTREILENAADFIALSDPPDSVARQLLDPIRLSSYGLLVIPRPSDSHDAENYDFTVPAGLLKILEALRYPESEKVFHDWLTQCTSSEPNVKRASDLLKVLVNFTSLLDSGACEVLWGPPELPSHEREEEVLLQPFGSLLRSVEFAIRDLERQTGVLERGKEGKEAEKLEKRVGELKSIKDLIMLRYAEVYSLRHRTSLYTFAAKALRLSPERFAQLALSMVESYSPDGHNLSETAEALVKLAESIGVEDINPLINRMGFQLDLRGVLIEKAKRAGLLLDEEAVAWAIERLKEEPLRDAANVDFAEVIGNDITDLEIYVFTGTFGPFTKGHKDLLEKLLAYLGKLPRREGDRVFQRIVLIVPITDVSGIRYEKNPAQVGSVEERIGSILLQLAGTVNPKEIFVTTRLQPHPAVTRSLEERVRHTSYSLLGKISQDLLRVSRAAGFERTIKYAFGPDELEWREKLGRNERYREIVSRDGQRDKVREVGGVVVVRRGWLLDIIRNHELLESETGVETVILTPGTPYSSSSTVIKEIAETGDTRAVEAPARNFVLNHWSPEAMARRRAKIARAQVKETKGQEKVFPLPKILSIDEIRERLIKELATLG